ncbi:MAG: metallophosphoesterase [Rhodothermaceae bacterium]|nr:metallophosphoesterase [Rhodothermaceae bacterium]
MRSSRGGRRDRRGLPRRCQAVPRRPDADAAVTPSPRYRLAHLSDVHFGKIAHPEVVEALVEEVNAAETDLVVVSGDLTQRARTHQFKAAKAMLDAFESPTLVVPGNHDVRAWWHNPIERVFQSSSRFARFITDDLTPTFTRPGLAVFGLNSAHGLTIKGGKIRPRHLEAMQDFFGAQPAGTFRVLVLHHHLLRLQALGDHDIARGAKHALRAAGASGVDLILCGHLHTSHVEHAEIVPPSEADPAGHSLVIASAGTATSSRGRGQDREVNFYNWITVEAERFIIEERRFEREEHAFAEARTTAFHRADG